MKRFAYTATAKVIAVLLLCVCALVFLAGLLCTAELQNTYAFSNGFDSARQTLLYDLGLKKLRVTGDDYFYAGFRGSDIFPNTNFRFSIELEDGHELYSNYRDEDVLWAGTMVYHIPSDWQENSMGSDQQPISYVELAPSAVPQVPVVTPQPIPQPSDALAEELEDASDAQIPATALIRGYVLSDLPAQDEFSFRLNLFTFLYQSRYIAIAAVFSASFSALQSIVTCCVPPESGMPTAGLRPGGWRKSPMIYSCSAAFVSSLCRLS